MPRKKLGEMLVEAGVLTESGLRLALGEQRRWGGTLGRTLVEMKLISEPELVGVLAAQLNLPTIDLENRDIHPTVIDLVPSDVAQEHTIIPFAQPMKFLDVAMADPTNLGVIDELRIRTQLNIRPYLAGPKAIERAIGKFYGVGFGRHAPRPEIAIALDTGGDVLTPDPSSDRLVDGPKRPARGMLQRAPTPVLDPYGASPDAGPPPLETRHAEIDALQERISTLEALVQRDEQVLRKLLALLVEKGVATRDEIMERIR
jgi:type IV pilus assembly protein PilB